MDGIKKRVIFEINNSCNLRCMFCPVNKFHSYLPMSELKQRINHYGKRFEYLGISGGEPLLHPEIDQIIDLFSNIADVVVLSTNGTIKPSFSYTPNLGTQINLPSIDPHVYSVITNSDAVMLENVEENLNRFKERSGLGVYIKVVLCDANSEDKYIKQIIDFSINNDVKVQFYPVVITTNTINLRDKLMTKKVLYAIDYLIPKIIFTENLSNVSLVSRDKMKGLIYSHYEYYIRFDNKRFQSLFHAYCDV
ncbi:radical SAM protein [Candidatus Micrarchaeota archaeon]|nr:radical SAM protein [Candidatus Micrarchaeota archaeon]